jgi:hypothetical protein
MKILCLLLILFFVGFSKPKKNNKCMEIQSIYIYDYFKNDNIVDDRKCSAKIRSLASDTTINKIKVSDSISKLLNETICKANQRRNKYYRTDSKNIYAEIIDINGNKHLVVISSQQVLTDYLNSRDYCCENSIVIKNLFEKYYP